MRSINEQAHDALQQPLPHTREQKAFFNKERENIREVTSAVDRLTERWGECRKTADSANLVWFLAHLNHVQNDLCELNRMVSALQKAATRYN